MILKRCIRCLLPETKPDLLFDKSGLCNACTAYDRRKDINWGARERSFAELAEMAAASGSAYDCVVPVSGGKDSTWQVLKCLQHGMHTLAVTAMTDDLSEIGRLNLENISKLGVDHIEISMNPRVRRRINKHTLQEVGDISWAEHVSIFTVPVSIASKLGVPLIMWGENSQTEYGGPEWAQHREYLDRRWLEEFGGLNGLRVSDIIDAGVATEKDMRLYTYPSQEDLVGVRGIFMGHYFPWSGWQNARMAEPHGWIQGLRPVEGSGFRHENLDNFQTGIHDRLKWLKFGFGRATDMASTAIREGRMTRKEGLAHVRQWDGEFPWTYLGKSTEHILARIDMTMEEYLMVEARFANKRLFRVGNDLSIVPLFEVH